MTREVTLGCHRDGATEKAEWQRPRSLQSARPDPPGGSRSLSRVRCRGWEVGGGGRGERPPRPGEGWPCTSPDREAVRFARLYARRCVAKLSLEVADRQCGPQKCFQGRKRLGAWLSLVCLTH